MDLRRWMRLGAVACALALTGADSGRCGESLGAPAVEAALVRLGSGDAHEQQKALLQLEALRDASTADEVRARIESRDAGVRAYAVRALAAIEGMGAVPVILERLAGDRDPWVRRAALTALEPWAKTDFRIAETMVSALNDRSPEVRMVAADVVSRLSDAEAARGALEARRRRERHRDVRRVLDALLDEAPGRP
ncbi:MAG TPA: HEAT repeat domain-containing protein [bacterium]